jgi:tRNA pseudouridine55 synthase
MAAPARRLAVAGVLVADKPPGVTSFAVVARARRALGERRIGHAGTLDPAAVGVLPLLVGEATKLMPYLVDQDKEYVVGIRLGITTDTHDLDGRVVATAPAPLLSRERLEQACRRFVGRIRQVPPMYSAVHHEGRRLYELAREGVEVVRSAREVVVHEIDVLALDGDRVTARIVCGKGAYVRVIAADLGADLGCGAAVEHLTRTRVGPFTRAEALAFGDLLRLERAAIVAALRPVEAALAGWPSVDLDEQDAAAFLHGQQVALPDGGMTGQGDLERAGAHVIVRDRHGRLLGIGRPRARGTRVGPERIIHADRSGTRVLPA